MELNFLVEISKLILLKKNQDLLQGQLHAAHPPAVHFTAVGQVVMMKVVHPIPPLVDQVIAPIANLHLTTVALISADNLTVILLVAVVVAADMVVSKNAVVVDLILVADQAADDLAVEDQAEDPVAVEDQEEEEVDPEVEVEAAEDPAVEEAEMGIILAVVGGIVTRGIVSINE